MPMRYISYKHIALILEAGLVSQILSAVSTAGYSGVLVSDGTDLIFFIVSCMMLCFGFGRGEMNGIVLSCLAG